MIKRLGTEAAERQRGEQGQNTPRVPTQNKQGKIRRFIQRSIRILNNIFSYGQEVANVVSPYQSDSCEEMARSGSATSKKFLLMSELFSQNGYMVGPKIGSGNYAKVRVVERREDGKILAAKIIIPDKAPKDYVKNFMPRELEIIRNIRHEHIAGAYDVVRTEKMIFIVMDYAQRGDLLEHIRNNGPPKEKESRKIFKQVVSAVQHLHRAGIVHRDLKCENLLIKKNGDILLTDFGFSRKFDETGKGSHTFCGSAAYASPQLIEGITYNPFLNDVWSLGCILFILACGSMPFDDTNIKKMVKKQKEGVYYPSKVRDKISKGIKDLIAKILVPEEENRYSVDDILKDPWVSFESEADDTSKDSIVKAESQPKKAVKM